MEDTCSSQMKGIMKNMSQIDVDRQCDNFTGRGGGNMPIGYIPIGYMPMPANFKYKELFLHGRPRHEKYDDFWRKHPPMDTVHRAKIFAPFDALAGFDEAINSKLVPYEERRILSETEKEELDKTLSYLQSVTYNSRVARQNNVQVSVCCFVPCTDEHNEWYGDDGEGRTGGRYQTVTGICRKVDGVNRTITVGEQTISFDDLRSITTGSE